VAFLLAMGRGFKLFISVIILLLPALVFIFLRYFGENKFDVPVQHPEGLRISDCNKQGAPHKVPAIDSLRLDQDIFQLLYVDSGSIDKLELNELRRISENYPEIEVLLFFADKESALLTKDYSSDNWYLFILKNELLKELNRCGFGNINNQSLILKDPEQQVRGYYDINQKKEMDRLEGEIQILI
jgi:protein SCO1/2